jgi:hypothetical protein
MSMGCKLEPDLTLAEDGGVWRFRSGCSPFHVPGSRPNHCVGGEPDELEQGDKMKRAINERNASALRWAHLCPALLAVACSSTADKPAEEAGPFKSMTVSANDSSQVVATQAGVPLGDGVVAFLASDATTLAPGVFRAEGNEIAPVHVGDFVSPFDIDVAGDGSVVVADSSFGLEAGGALLGVSLESGELTTLGADGYHPVSVTVGREGAHADSIYFSGRNPETGDPGVFRLTADGSLESLYEGEPLVEPSGIALLEDGGVIVGETSLNGGTEAALYVIEAGTASVLVRGLRSSWPFGIALTPDEAAVIVSAQDPHSYNDSVYTVPVAGGAPTKAAEFAEEMSSGGLKQGRDAGIYAWASTSKDGGTVFTVVAR